LVRNILRTYRIAWTDIQRIDPPPPYGRFRNAGIVIDLNDGRRMYANLYSRGPISRNTFGDDVVGQLRELQTRYAGDLN
jgi:hypothetical protein